MTFVCKCFCQLPRMRLNTTLKLPRHGFTDKEDMKWFACHFFFFLLERFLAITAISFLEFITPITKAKHAIGKTNGQGIPSKIMTL